MTFVPPLAVFDPGAIVEEPTAANLRDWSTGMAEQVLVLSALIDDYDAEISELDARRLKLVADKAKTVGVRAVLSIYAQGAANWSTVVKP